MPAPLPLLFALLLAGSGAHAATTAPDWQDYAADVFEHAAETDRLILLDLVAVWCHWCHVMEETTYRDARVIERLRAGFVAVQADHDARPDLAERYRDYGWPATIILRADGAEVVKRAGYIAPDAMLELLDEAARRAPRLAAPTVAVPGEEPASPVLTDTLRHELERRHVTADDPQHGGLALQQKFLDADAVEWDLRLAARGDDDAARRARRHLDGALALIDPAFGGAYQYSTHGDWAHPHFEKIMRTQLAYLRAYSLAYAQLGDARYRAAAYQVVAWLRDFMRADDGGFYTSQDADRAPGRKAHDYFALGRAQRLARGIPRIDRNRYADINGMAIEGLVTLYHTTRDADVLALAVDALRWTLRQRRTGQGGYTHAASDPAGPYLGDSLYMGRALLAVYEASGQQAWLRAAQASADFIDVHFRRRGGGLLAAADNGTPVDAVAQIDQNIAAARFLYALAAHTGEPRHTQLADHAMRFLTSPATATSRLTDAGILLADEDRDRLGKSQYSLSLISINKKGGSA